MIMHARYVVTYIITEGVLLLHLFMHLFVYLFICVFINLFICLLVLFVCSPLDHGCHCINGWRITIYFSIEISVQALMKSSYYSQVSPQFCQC